MKIIGLYSDIGGGKSFVAEIFRENGAVVINADLEISFLLHKPEIIEQIKEIFPEAVNENKINRKQLSEIVFDDKNKLEKLENILHPPVVKIIWDEIAQLKSKNVEFVILDIPLLADSEFEKICDVKIFIDTPDTIRMERVENYRGMKKEDICKREKFQPSRTMKKSKADFIINNSRGKDETVRQIKQIIQKIN